MLSFFSILLGKIINIRNVDVETIFKKIKNGASLSNVFCLFKKADFVFANVLFTIDLDSLNIRTVIFSNVKMF